MEAFAELAYSVQPLYEVVRQAKKIESNIFEASNSKENYASTMDQLILNMKELIEDKTKIHLEQLATKSILDSMDKRIKQIKEETEMKGRSINIDNINYIINNENDEEDVKRIKEILQIEERLLKESWQKYIDEQMGRLHQQRQMHSERLRLSIQNMQLNQQQNGLNRFVSVHKTTDVVKGQKILTIEEQLLKRIMAKIINTKYETSTICSESTKTTNLSSSGSSYSMVGAEVWVGSKPSFIPSKIGFAVPLLHLHPLSELQ
ncbi:3001_t:CDS:2 [Entrophospora sp. SA101]|nr:3001_t:CDS:2 [Entrophospora sp. SA101]